MKEYIKTQTVFKRDPNKVTKEEILENWEYYLNYLVDILNKDYDLDEAIEDIKSLRNYESK